MNQEIEEIFRVCDILIENAKIDYKDWIEQKIDETFFKDYANTRIVNSFLFNFSKLQDKIGAKLFRKVLYEAKEIDSLALSMIDILNILEKLEIIENKALWDELREIRNSLAHEYPYSLDERVENILLALDSFKELESIYKKLKEFSFYALK